MLGGRREYQEARLEPGQTVTVIGYAMLLPELPFEDGAALDAGSPSEAAADTLVVSAEPGGREALNSNQNIARTMIEAGQRTSANFPGHAIQVVPVPDRHDAVRERLHRPALRRDGMRRVRGDVRRGRGLR